MRKCKKINKSKKEELNHIDPTLLFFTLTLNAERIQQNNYNKIFLEMPNYPFASRL